MKDDKGDQPSEFPRTGLQPGIDQTEAGTGKSSPLHNDARSGIAGSKLDAGVGEAGRTQLMPEDPIKHSSTYDASKYPIAQPRATEHKQQDVIAPSPHATTNLGGVNTPKDAGYAPLHESIASGATSVTGSVGSYASQGKGIPSTKPATTDIGLTPAISKIDAKPDTSKIGSATKGHVESEPLLKHKADDNKAAHGTGMGLPNFAQDTGFNSTKPFSTNTSSAPDVSKITAKFDASSTGFSTGAQSDAAGSLHHKAQENKAAHGSGMGLPNSAQDTLSKGGKDDASSFSFDNKLDKKTGGSILDSARDHSDSSSKRSDYTSALDKITDSTADSGTATSESKGVTATAAEYISSGAQAVAQKAKEVRESVDSGTATKDAKANVQGASDKTKAAGQSVVDSAAQGTKTVGDAVKPYTDAAADQAKAAVDAVQEKSGIAGRNDMTVLQKAQAVVQTAAAATAEKASQAYQVVAQKVHETGLPQAAAGHAATARDTAAGTAATARDRAAEHAAAAKEVAAAKYSDLSAEAQRQQEAGKAALEQGKMHVQEAGRAAQQKAAELAQNVREASVEDVNRSWLGRTAGGIVLVALASYALGVPFRYGLAAALFALAAVLFADWDRSRSVGGRSSPLMHTRIVEPKTVEVRPEMLVTPTEFGIVKAHAGRIEEHPLTGARFVKEE
ncbi:hypothetical protein COCSUDRAFT_56195 [Coccomyxa subellipsoidea C-169]|uniref:Uncharacterized protein n=1 Tax=Coccomyxa subellipsoidea (strain C-169) TaxID=574566 RepID=I0YTM3_COCSC|nr:hypothetical protein COCSUDRAFT_56195 [Coccomyxa subellipsoidea C-169]EIE21742.1 hypothetical protein COCSUDRAFT_56195 [Coccomyxa subellipsoidea C-169]|eukprot:XP_005646286.1 hypothetical protein COCSUDRAFT_56195 [Coccomyxa subellipsoidea C-169]